MQLRKCSSNFLILVGVIRVVVLLLLNDLLSINNINVTYKFCFYMTLDIWIYLIMFPVFVIVVYNDCLSKCNAMHIIMK